MKKELWFLCLGIASALPTTGCGTIGSMLARDSDGGGEPYDGPLIYGGVYYDWVELIPGLFRSGDSMSGILMILDLPLSFIADTIMLPLTVTDHLLAKDPVPSEGPTHPAVSVGGGRTADETPAVEPMLTEPRRLPPEP